MSHDSNACLSYGFGSCHPWPPTTFHLHCIHTSLFQQPRCTFHCLPNHNLFFFFSNHSQVEKKPLRFTDSNYYNTRYHWVNPPSTTSTRKS
jgi:hypothetical protein